MKRFNVTGMSCAACSARVERAVSSLPGVDRCSVNLLGASMVVEGEASEEKIISAVVAAGYGASVKNSVKVNETLQNGQKPFLYRRLIGSAVLLVFLMYISMGAVMWGTPLPRFLESRPMLIGIIEMLLAAAVMVINRRFFINGVRGIINLAPNMDTLVALGSGVAFVYSAVTLVFMAGAGEHAVHYLHGLYFESAAMIPALITVGKTLEERAKGRTASAVRELMELAPRSATVLRDGVECVVPVGEVAVGDIFLVRPGESVPVDGVVIFGTSAVSEAALTGESVPVDKAAGDSVLAATVNTSGFLKCEATRVGDDTAIASVIRLVDEASSTKAPIARLADKVSGVFVPFVMALSLITLLVWWLVRADFGFALSRAIAVLVISCPCALGLATPVAIMVGSGVGAKLGVLFKNAEALELVGRARVIALDKTGTVTYGMPRVTDVIALGADEAELLRAALAVEKNSEHPLARAVVEYAEKYATREEVSDFEALVGSGVRARLGRARIEAGKLSFIRSVASVSDEAVDISERLSGEGKTPLFFAMDGRLLGIIAVADSVREDTKYAIDELKKLGMRVVMLTGDSERCARAVAREAGIDEVLAELLPADKAEAVRSLSAEARVIMVGDGINDSPALTAADVGMAIGGGTDVAIESANVVLVRDSLSDAVRAIRLGRAVLGNIKENLFWAFAYNAVSIPFAAGVFGLSPSPMIGAAAMSLSSITVVMNALRLGLLSDKYAGKSEDNDNNNLQNEDKNMEIVIKIDGMMCPHCEARVKKILESFDFVESAVADWKEKRAVVKTTAEPDLDALCRAITDDGYEVLGVEK